ncbi:MAG: hypothetical protein ABJH68_13015 [Ilumatobacter sp.]|uniref:hypothetical protein n=1 Tax=Ilumatobacter sp. TaxID=1967498 RepID=UPI003298DC6F
MQTKQVGLAGLRGWRSSVAGAVARPVARRSPFGEDQVRAVIGAAFLALSIVYVVTALKDAFTDGN